MQFGLSCSKPFARSRETINVVTEVLVAPSAG
jgi:hypothetical protein